MRSGTKLSRQGWAQEVGTRPRMEPGSLKRAQAGAQPAGQQELEQAHSPGMLLLPSSSSCIRQGAEPGDLECHKNIPRMPSEQSLSSKTFPVPTVTWGGLVCGFCFSSVGIQGFVQT